MEGLHPHACGFIITQKQGYNNDKFHDFVEFG